jgi:nucleoid-associated protein YgaU
MGELSFERLNARKEPLGDSVTVPYNPNELAFSKGADFAEVAIPGLDGPVLQYVRGQAETLALELFFDSTDEGRGEGARSVVGGQRRHDAPGAVMAGVDRLHRLVKLDGALHHPPIVRISWGPDFPGLALGDNEAPRTTLDAVVVKCDRRFTLFSTEGAPLRAVVSLQLREYLTLAEQVELANLRSSDHTRVHVVREGETLPLIAFDAYEDASKWRLIAAHNDLAQVRRLAPGTRLELPPSR